MEHEQRTRRKNTRRGRASRACGRCRDRKVRCDVVRRGTTCTNCEIDQVPPVSRFRSNGTVSSQIQVTCIDNYVKRRRLEYSSLRSSSFSANRNHSEPACDDLVETSGPAAFSHEAPIHESTSHFMDVPYMDPSPIVPVETYHVAVAPPQTQDDARQKSSNNRLDLETATDFPRNLYLAETPAESCSYGSSPQLNAPPPRLHGFDPPTPVSDLSSQRQVNVSIGETGLLFDLPKFVIDNRQHLEPEDCDFLGLKNVWKVPPLPVLEPAIQGFVDYIYPSLPVVDIFTELETLETNGRSRQMSLMLLYAMVLPGIPFMDPTAVSEAGYASSSEFARTIHGRIKLLYDFNYEQDRLVTVQCLILMTYYHDQTDGQKHLRHWLTIAHRLALEICLNRDFWSAAADSKQRQHWKRIWWCLFIRDRTCAIGMRQFPIVAAQECHWPELDKNDFVTPEPCLSVLVEFRNSQYLQDRSLQAELASICIAQAQLWQQLDSIMQLRHSILSPRYGNTRETTLILGPRPLPSNDQTMQHCKQKLQSWTASHSDKLIFQFGYAAPFDTQPVLLTIHACMLNLLFHALQCMLHRPFQKPMISGSADHRSSCFTAKSSASAILSIFEYAKVQDIIHLLPGWAVTVLMQAALTFKDFSTENAAQTCRRWQDCIEVLEVLQLRHLHAAFGIALLRSFIAVRTRKAEPGKVRASDPMPVRSMDLQPDLGPGGSIGGGEDANTGPIVFGGYENALKDLDDLGLCDPALASPWLSEFFDQNM